MRTLIFKKDKRYTFSDYFTFNYPPEEIFAELGYTVNFKALALPTDIPIDSQSVEKLTSTYYELLPKVSLNSEIAKREFIIAPLLYEVIRHIDARLNVEYPLNLDDPRLGGSIDYLLRGQQALVVIEAKKGDLERGFNQLAAEMIALDLYEAEHQPAIVYGAITVGEIWRFAQLERKTKSIFRDVHSFRFPEDVEALLAILKGLLVPVPHTTV